MRNKGMRTVKLTDLQLNLFVRNKLDQEHALCLAELLESGVMFNDPIEVTDRGGVMNIIVDGRHRREAFELNGVTEVRVRVLEFDNEAETIAYAYKANTGGSLPPTAQDTEHTVLLLLEHGESVKRIGELLGLPAGLARKYINSVRSKVLRQKLMNAATAVTNGGLTVAKAAEQYEVDADKVREMLSGHRRKHKVGVAEVQRNLTKAYKSLSSRNAALISSLLKKLEDCEVNARQVCDIFAHLENLQKQSANAVAGWKKRFEAANSKATKAA